MGRDKRLEEIRNKVRIGGVMRLDPQSVHNLSFDTRWLLEEVDRLEKEKAESFWAAVKLETENHAMKEALEWYALPKRYSSDWTDPNDPDYSYQRTPEVYGDGGKLARAILSTLSQPKEAPNE